MPIWAELMINLIGYAGFIVLASRGSVAGDERAGGDEVGAGSR
jgi:hypothetical protein